jgi:SAM-dependent methyltransferase
MAPDIAQFRLKLRPRLARLKRPALLGTLRRTEPISHIWGYDRGNPVDRYYIESFMEEHRPDVRGRVLEVKDSTYTWRYSSGVEQADVLDIDPENPDATVVADLSAADQVPADQFDCFILTQTLQLIYDLRGAIYHAHRMLKPGGVLLATVPAVSRIARKQGIEHDFWRFTPASCNRLFAEHFGEGQVEVRSYGNVLSGIAFLSGMALEELSRAELEKHDPYFPVVLAVRAIKRGSEEVG